LSYLDKVRKFLVNQKTTNKSILAFLLDIGVYFLIYLIFNNEISITNNEIFYYTIFCVFNTILLINYGYYKNKIKFINVNAILSSGLKSLRLLIIINLAFLLFYNTYSFFLLISTLNVILIMYAMRAVVRLVLYGKKSLNRPRVLIYGSGAAGVQLVNNIDSDRRYNIIGFLDDSIEKINRKIGNILVYHPDDFQMLVKKYNIEIIFIAIPSMSFNQRKELVKNLMDKKLNIRIKILPSLNTLINQNINFDLMEDISIEDIIGRKVVPPIDELLEKNIVDKTILITGAAGTIGSELCKKILENNPKKVIMTDCSEIGLFNLINDLKKYEKNTHFLLGDLKDNIFIKNFLSDHNDIDIVYHVAAYKHVNILEKNQFPGFYNNVIIVRNLIDNLLSHSSVKRFVNVSTDKAVEPTNIMGLSKYFCELIVNEYSKKTDIEFSIVRFGNVLKSSGSVLTIFDQQIKNDKSVTVTDKNVKRYFMSVEEAVSLIIQSSSLEGSNRRFILDMGEQLSIYKIAEKMILLNGFSIKSEDNPKGDIDIKIIGLQEGEKLEDDLIRISGRLISTQHPMISKIDENLPELNLENFFKLVMENYNSNNNNYLSGLMRQVQREEKNE